MPPRYRRRRIADSPSTPSHNTRSCAFRFPSLPPEIQQLIGRYWHAYPFGLPTDALSKQLRATLDNPVDIARRAVSRFGSPRKALLQECDRPAANVAVTQFLINRCDASAGDLRDTLVRVCCTGDVERVRLLLAAGAGTHGWHPPSSAHLTLRSHFGGLEIMMTLLGDIQRLNMEAQQGMHSDDYPLRVACGHGHVEVVKLLMESGLQLSKNERAAMTAACRNGHVDIVKYLVERKSGFLEEGLWEACRYGHAAVVEQLLAQGANIKGGVIREALCIAARRGHVEVVRLLLETGTDFDTWGVRARETEYPIRTSLLKKREPSE
ncbi:hypothetical protein HDU93_000424 [Gonapodya sp. JEL0774]|nr:hypothetical protein HDU93_000424 [Gonapodya sp. JEL0774]